MYGFSLWFEIHYSPVMISEDSTYKNYELFYNFEQISQNISTYQSIQSANLFFAVLRLMILFIYPKNTARLIGVFVDGYRFFIVYFILLIIVKNFKKQ